MLENHHGLINYTEPIIIRANKGMHAEQKCLGRAPLKDNNSSWLIKCISQEMDTFSMWEITDPYHSVVTRHVF